MSKADKRLQRIRSNPKTVSMDDLDALLLDYGFDCRKGNHSIYSRGRHRISVPPNRPHVKEIYVKHVLLILAEIDEEDS